MKGRSEKADGRGESGKHYLLPFAGCLLTSCSSFRGLGGKSGAENNPAV